MEHGESEGIVGVEIKGKLDSCGRVSKKVSLVLGCDGGFGDVDGDNRVVVDFGGGVV